MYTCMNKPSHIYTLSQQFPPFNAIDGANTVLSVFVPGFVLPLNFKFDQDVTVEGVKLKRFKMANDTFSSSRSDAKVCVYYYIYIIIVCMCVWLGVGGQFDCDGVRPLHTYLHATTTTPPHHTTHTDLRHGPGAAGRALQPHRHHDRHHLLLQAARTPDAGGLRHGRHQGDQGL